VILGIRMIQSAVTVLVLDDESLILRLVNSFLRDTRFVAILAADLIVARRICDETERTINVLLCDASMSDEGAAEFWECMGRRFPAVRAVYMSGFPEHQVEVPEWPGRRLFLQKPFSADDLIGTLERAVQPVHYAGGS
jgi:DNA-binding NtrC family response regulator